MGASRIAIRTMMIGETLEMNLIQNKLGANGNPHDDSEDIIMILNVTDIFKISSIVMSIQRPIMRYKLPLALMYD